MRRTRSKYDLASNAGVTRRALLAGLATLPAVSSVRAQSSWPERAVKKLFLLALDRARISARG